MDGKNSKTARFFLASTSGTNVDKTRLSFDINFWFLFGIGTLNTYCLIIWPFLTDMRLFANFL